MKPSDRRKTPRIDVEGPLTALALSASKPTMPVQAARVINVSFGGFLVESPTSFEPGDIYDFRFKTADGRRPAVFKARAIYRVERALADPDSQYAAGFAFLNGDDPFTLWRIRELIKAVGTALESADAPKPAGDKLLSAGDGPQ